MCFSLKSSVEFYLFASILSVQFSISIPYLTSNPPKFQILISYPLESRKILYWILYLTSDWLNSCVLISFSGIWLVEFVCTDFFFWHLISWICVYWSLYLAFDWLNLCVLTSLSCIWLVEFVCTDLFIWHLIGWIYVYWPLYLALLIIWRSSIVWEEKKKKGHKALKKKLSALLEDGFQSYLLDPDSKIGTQFLAKNVHVSEDGCINIQFFPYESSFWWICLNRPNPHQLIFPTHIKNNSEAIFISFTCLPKCCCLTHAHMPRCLTSHTSV